MTILEAIGERDATRGYFMWRSSILSKVADREYRQSPDGPFSIEKQGKNNIYRTESNPNFGKGQGVKHGSKGYRNAWEYDSTFWGKIDGALNRTGLSWKNHWKSDSAINRRKK